VEQLGAGSGTEGVEAFSESALEFVGSHGTEATPSNGHSACLSICIRERSRKPAGSPSMFLGNTPWL
jgi:hypothetical protein